MGLVAQVSTGRSGFPVTWRTVGLTLLIPLAVANLLLAWDSIIALTRQEPWDWRIWVDAADDIYAGRDPYAGSLFVWPPLTAYGLGVMEWIGPDLWRFLHLPAVLAFPTWTMRLLVLVSYPFWFDVNTGNLLVFTALLAVYALRGQRWAGCGFLALALLVPRPLMLPIMVWLLWKEPSYRVGFAALVGVMAAGVLLTGLTVEWLEAMLRPGRDMWLAYNISPSRWLGYAWLVIGIPLGVWLTIKGRLGWASLAVSPYVLPYYLLMLTGLAPALRDLDRHDPGVGGRNRRVVAAGLDP